MLSTNVDGEDLVREAPVQARLGARDHIKAIRSLRLRVRLTVYPAICILQAINYFVFGFSPTQTLVTAIGGMTIGIFATETAFVRGFQLHKRTLYPRAVLEALGTVDGIAEAGDRALEVIGELLRVSASFIIVPNGDDWIPSVSGLSRESVGRIIGDGAQAIGEATRTRTPAIFDPAGSTGSDGESGRTRIVFIPMIALQEPIGVLAVVGDKGNRDLNDDQLLSSIGIAVGLSLKTFRQKETIRHLAYHDGLTNLPNRRLFEDRLNVALAKVRRSRRTLAVMFLDLDRFKAINDTVGHALGDRLLKNVAERLGRLVRDGDTVARIGGDEFTFLLAEGTELAEVAQIAERVLEACRRPWPIDGHEFRITASIGIAVYPDDGDDAESLIRSADAAMYCAKQQGRDTCHFYAPDMKTANS